MELDELKSGWDLLNRKLEENEILNKKIIYEMIKTRTQTVFDKLFRYEISGAITVIVVAIVFLFTNRFKSETIIFIEIGIVISFILQCTSIFYIQRFNIEKKNLVELSILIIKYKVIVKKIRVYSIALALLMILTICYMENITQTNVLLFVFGSVIIFLCAAYFLEYLFFKKSFTKIENGLNELKEYEEDLIQ